MKLRPFFKALTLALLVFALSACGKTRIKIVNQSTSSFGTVTVALRSTGIAWVSFGNVVAGSVSTELDWPDSNSMDVTLSTASPAIATDTDGVSLDTGKVNTITLTDVAGKIHYVNAAN